MTILNEGKDIFLYQGDTGNITFKNLPTDKNYNVYLSIYDPDENKIIKELLGTYTQSAGTVLFSVNEDISNSLPVGDWVYGVKICSGGSEDTLLPRAYIDETGSLIKEPAPKFTVDYKVVEGD